MRHRGGALALVLALLPGAGLAATAGAPVEKRASDLLSLVPVRVEPNRGQLPDGVRLGARAGGGSALLGDDGILLVPAGAAPSEGIRLRLASGREIRPEPSVRLPGVANVVRGPDPARWVLGIPGYEAGVYRDAAPGVDISLHGRRRVLEIDVALAPGALLPERLLEVEGALGFRLEPDGRLTLSGAAGEVTLLPPVAVQQAAGGPREVAARYRLVPPCGLGVELGPRDAAAPVLVDPVIVFATPIGGTQVDRAHAVAVSSDGTVTIAGSTDSADFPVSSGGVAPKANGDAFVVRLDPARQLVFSTTIGGGVWESADGVAVDPAGNAAVAGRTTSPDFPTTAGAPQRTYGGTPTGSTPEPAGDAWAARLSPSGAPLWVTYLGGSRGDDGEAVAVDSQGNVYVLGNTTSRNFPVTPGAYQTTRAGSTDYAADAFVTKIEAAGTRLAWSTYLGGTGVETGYFYGLGGGLAVQSNGEVTVCGTAGTGFPTTPGAYQASVRGTSDAFVARLAADGSRLVFSTVLGGGGQETPWGIALDATGAPVVFGSTYSSDFPVTPGAFQGTYRGGITDFFVSKLSASGSSLLWSTLLGGGGAESFPLNDAFGAVAPDPQGGAWVTGHTDSPDFPVTSGALQAQASQGNLFRSSDGGVSFSRPARSPAGSSVQTVLVDNTNANALWLRLENDVVRTTDGGATWQSVRPPARSDQTVQALAHDRIATGILLAGHYTGTTGTPAAALYRSSNGGASWSLVTTGLPSDMEVWALEVDVRRSGTAYASGNRGFFRTTNSAGSWSPAGSGLAATPRGLFHDTRGGGTLWATDGMKLQRSTDGGVTFLPAATGLPTVYSMQLAFDSGSGPVYVATALGVWASTDGGQTFVERNTGIPSGERYLRAIAAHPSQPGVAWAVGTKVFRTTDAGATWTAGPALATTPTGAARASGYGLWIGGSLELDAFVAHLSPLGELLHSTYLGGQAEEKSRGIALDGAGRVYVAGATSSSDFPFQGALQPWRGSDAFLAVLGDGPSLSVSPASIDFGKVPVGSSTEKTLSVKNAGTGTLTGTVTAPAPFGVVSGGTLSVAAGATQAVFLKFQPSAAGAASGTAVVTTNGGSATVPLTGTGETPAGPALSVTPSSLAFGEVAVGATSDKSVTVKNAGSGTLTGTATTTAPYSVVSGGSFSLAAGQTATVAVRFSPAASGSFPGTLQVASNGGNAQVPMTGSAKEVGTTLVVPVLVIAAGNSGSYFTSELTLANGGAAPTEVDLTYTAAAGGGTGTVRQSLRAGEQKVVPNAIEWLKQLGLSIAASGTRVGTLSVRFRSVPSADSCAALVRTTTVVADGRAGLAYAGLTRDGLLSGPVLLTGLRQSAQDRANLAFVNGGGSGEGEVRIQATVYSGDPSAPTSARLPVISLQPGGFHQFDGVLVSNGLSLSNAWVLVERLSGTAPWYAYAVVNDQGSSDGSFIVPVPVGSGKGKKRSTLPVVVETTDYTSELIATNVSAGTRSVELRFVADAVTATGNEARVTLTLAAREQRVIPSFVQYLRERGVAGVGPAGKTFAGAVFAHVLDGDSADVLVSARTSSPGVKGRYGLFYGAVPDGQAATGSVWINGVRQDAENRTNLAYVNTGETDGSTVVLRVEVFDGDTGTLAKTQEGETVAARRWKQVGSVLTQFAPGVKNARLRLTRTSGNNPFLVYAVVNDGAVPDQRSDDGAFVPMTLPTVVAAPAITVSPASLAFGSVAVGSTKDLAVTVTSSGTAALTVSAVASSAAQYSTPGLSTPFTLQPGATKQVTVRFAPSSASSFPGTLSVSSNDAARPRVDVSLTGQGTAPTTEELTTDDGSPESGVVQDGLVIVNRLTPSRYPATLKTIRVYVAQFTGLPNPSGATIRVVGFADTSGSGTPPRPASYFLDQAVTVPAVTGGGAWVDLTVSGAAPLPSGDLYVGFRAPTPAGGVGFAADTNGTPKRRGFYSTDGGATYQGPLVLTGGGTTKDANILIRAVVSSP